MIGANLAKESLAAARGQPVWSLLTAAMLAAMVLAVMFTTGRAVAGQRAVIGTLDEAGTRTIIVRADGGVAPSALQRIDAIEGVEWSGGFSAAIDASNANISGGVPVSVRRLYSRDLRGLGVPGAGADDLFLSVAKNPAYASESTLQLIGMPDAAGAITTTDGQEYAVVGQLAPNDYLDLLQPVVLVPFSATDLDSISQIIVIAANPDQVSAVAEAITPLLGVDDPSAVTVETSQALVDVRTTVRDQLGSTGRSLVFGMLATTSVLVAIVQFSLVMFRRKDYGRRRALGATRSLIVRLVVAQTMWLAGAGVTLGAIGGALWLQLTSGYWPGIRFTVGLSCLAMLAAALAALVPALVASRRDPLVELRVP